MDTDISNTSQPISTYLQYPSQQDKKKGRAEQERDKPFNELYNLYTSPTQRMLRRIENWRRYRLWLMSKRIPHTNENVNKFKKVKKGLNHFINEWSVSTFAVKISHIKTEDLYYVLSVARDMNHRNESIGAWLFQKPR